MSTDKLRQHINKIINEELTKNHFNENVNEATFEINSKLISTFPGMKFKRFKSKDCNKEGAAVTLGRVSLKPSDFGVFGSTIKKGTLEISAGCSIEYNACMIIGKFSYEHHYGSNGYTVVLRSRDGGKTWNQEK